MADHKEDPRDEVSYSTLALRAVVSLLRDVGNDRRQFDCTVPHDLAELLEMPLRRLEAAEKRLHDYVPRDRA